MVIRQPAHWCINHFVYLPTDNCYANGNYMMQPSAAADLNMTECIACMVGTGEFENRVPAVVEGIGLVTGDYVSPFCQELSCELAGMSASIYEPAQTIDIQLWTGQ
jgi:hypothetical protein